jgi:hypothetical protein
VTGSGTPGLTRVGCSRTHDGRSRLLTAQLDLLDLQAVSLVEVGAEAFVDGCDDLGQAVELGLGAATVTSTGEGGSRLDLPRFQLDVARVVTDRAEVGEHQIAAEVEAATGGVAQQGAQGLHVDVELFKTRVGERHDLSQEGACPGELVDGVLDLALEVAVELGERSTAGSRLAWITLRLRFSGDTPTSQRRLTPRRWELIRLRSCHGHRCSPRCRCSDKN